MTVADAEVDFELDRPLTPPAGSCDHPSGTVNPHEAGPGDVPHTDTFKQLQDTTFQEATELPWLDGT